MFYYRLIFSKIRSVLGGRVQSILSGGAPLAADTHRNLKAILGCPIIQGMDRFFIGFFRQILHSSFSDSFTLQGMDSRRFAE